MEGAVAPVSPTPEEGRVLGDWGHAGLTFSTMLFHTAFPCRRGMGRAFELSLSPLRSGNGLDNGKAYPRCFITETRRARADQSWEGNLIFAEPMRHREVTSYIHMLLTEVPRAQGRSPRPPSLTECGGGGAAGAGLMVITRLSCPQGGTVGVCFLDSCLWNLGWGGCFNLLSVLCLKRRTYLLMKYNI